MVCIKCGNNFKASRIGVIACDDCKRAHIDRLGLVDALANVTLEDAELLKKKIEKELEMVCMLIDGKKISDIAQYADMTPQGVSSYFSRKIKWALADGNPLKRGEKLPDKFITYTPRKPVLLWPHNLYASVFGAETELPVDVDDAIEYALSKVSQRESLVVFHRFKESLSLEDVSNEIAVTKERVRQIENKALKKLKHPVLSNVLKKGLALHLKEVELENVQKKAANAALLAQADMDISKYLAEEEAMVQASSDMLKTPISYINFDVRAFNCLMRAGLKTVGDILKTPYADLIHIHNLGRKSLEHVIFKLKEHGFDYLELHSINMYWRATSTE